MSRAHAVDAARTGSFWFRKHVISPQDPQHARESLGNSFEEMTMNEIINGKGNYFPGLVPICYAYLKHIGCDAHTFTKMSAYLRLVQRRASGELLTPAAWMRRFVR